MSYGDPAEVADFTGFRMACLSGNNGDGKSALLDAMTWALWGMARGVDGKGAGADDLVRMVPGVEEALVEFEFEVGGARYLVTRSRNKRQGAGTLDLASFNGGSFQPITTRTKRGTQDLINQVLRMDYRTFINSAFLVQGRADEFTRQNPTERKQILAEILDLERYDRLEELARQRMRDAQRTLEVLWVEINWLESELRQAEQYQQEADRAQSELEAARAAAATAEQKSGEARQRVVELEGAEQRAAELREQLGTLTAELAQHDSQIGVFQQRITAAEQITAQREQVREGIERLQAARATQQSMHEKLMSLNELRQQLVVLEKEIARQNEQLQAELKQLARRQKELMQQRDAGERVQAELEVQQKRQAALRALEPDLEKAREHHETLLARQAELTERDRQVQIEINELQNKMKLWAQGEVECPLCEQPLSSGRRLKLLKQVREEGGVRVQSRRVLVDELTLLGEELKKSEAEAKRLGDQVGELPGIAGKLGELQRRSEEGAQAARELAQTERQMGEVQQRIASKDFARDEREQLAVLQSKMAELGYEAKAHEQANREATAYASYERRQAELESAEQSLALDRPALAELQKAHQEKASAITRTQEQITRFEQEASKLPQTRAEAAERNTTVAAAREGVESAAAQAASWQDKLVRMDEVREQLTKQHAAERQAQRDENIYNELATAFSKRGVQALIIESVVPVLEEEANQLLERLTEGQMRVHFQTQRDTRRGETVETLEVQISDQYGTRRYELYSGGEAFRVNFAVRVALSRLLAQRAGAKLQTLVIDEGFGTQDAHSRERLVQAIHAVQEDFEKVLVITHMEELKDSFAHRIEVTKDESGSHLLQVSLS